MHRLSCLYSACCPSCFRWITGSWAARIWLVFAAAPVCAPSRSAIITGIMPTTLGSLPMRCKATPPPHVVGFPTRLRNAGYWCTTNAKTDYNLDHSFQPGWHESGRTAHWRTRPDSTQPFFAVFNLHVTHESMLFGDKPVAATRGLPDAARRTAADIRVPPYYPDTPGIRQALAQRLELAAVLDTDVGKILDELAADGLVDDTIVFFWGDHGEGIPHGKRSLTEHGLREAVRIAAAHWLLKAGATSSADALATLTAETRADDADLLLAALVAIDDVGDAGRTLWRDAATLIFDKDEEYARRTVERIRAKLALGQEN